MAMKKDILRNRNFSLWFTVTIHLMLIIGFSLLLWEIYALNWLHGLNNSKIHYLYISRGLFSSFLLGLYAFWFIYRNRIKFENQLAVSEERNRAIIENSSDGIVTFDAEGIIQSWNRGAESIFGWKAADIIGQPFSELVCPRSEAYDINNDKSSDMQGYFDANYHRKEGGRIRVSVAEHKLYNLKGEVIGRSQIIRDVTQRDLQEAQMRHSEKLATIGHLTAGLAHEIGNPLTSISSLVQLIKRKSSDEWVIQNLDKVISHIRRISKIVREMVDFSRPSAANIQSISINDSISSAVGIFRYDDRAKYTEFDLDLGSELPNILCDPDQINQVILNIIINAVDANGETGKHVWISSKKKGQFVEIGISDEGSGIPEEMLSMIFEPFFTTKEVGKGTGLGLSVSHGIIKNLNGEIVASNRKDKGAQFLIKIPITRES